MSWVLLQLTSAQTWERRTRAGERHEKHFSPLGTYVPNVLIDLS
jgi:hypothetical protein